MEFEKMTVIQLKDYMRQHKIKGLSGRKADIIARIKEFQKIGSSNEYIYKNDLKSLYDNNIYTKMTVVQLKQFMRENKIKPLTGKKDDLIKTILASGYEIPMVEKQPRKSRTSKVKEEVKKDFVLDSTKIDDVPLRYSKKTSYIMDSKKIDKGESIEDLLQKRNIVDLLNLYNQINTLPKKVPKTKKGIIDKLVKYYEMSSMHGEDVNQFIPMAIPSADAFLPIPENIQNAIPMDNLYSGDFTEGEFINRSSLDPTQMKYNPADVEQHYQDIEDQYVSSNANRYPRIDLSMADLYEILPIDIVKDKLRSSTNDIVEFVSPYTSDRYDASDLAFQMLNTPYNMPNWKYNIFERDGRWVLDYTRIIPRNRIELGDMMLEEIASKQLELADRNKQLTMKLNELKKKEKKPVSVYPIEESIPSSSVVDKKITITRKKAKKPFNLEDYNINKIVEHWNDGSILDDFKMYSPSDYKNLTEQLKMHLKKWGKVTVVDSEGKNPVKKQAIYPAQLAGWVSIKLINALKKAYTTEKIYDGFYTLSFTLADEIGVIDDMDQLQDDGEDIGKYLK